MYLSSITTPTLPEEILGLVRECFSLPDYFNHFLRHSEPADHQYYTECLKTLRNACLASRQLYRLAWPILYRRFADYPRSDVKHRPASLGPVQFLQTICTKPKYGLALRSLSMFPWKSIEMMKPGEVLDLLQGDATLVALFNWRTRGFWLGGDEESGNESLISSAKPSSKPGLLPSILRSLDMGMTEAHMVLLLLLCPKIKELEICVAPQAAPPLFIKLLENTLSNDYKTAKPPDPINDFEQEEADYALAQMFDVPWRRPKLEKSAMLQDLEKCTLAEAGGPPFECSFMGKLLELPALQDLTIHSLHGGHRASLSDLKVSVPAIKLKKLSIVECKLSTREVMSIIEDCPNLLDLRIDWDVSMEMDMDILNHDPLEQDKILKFGTIGDALASHTPKLESLFIGACEWLHRHTLQEYPFAIGKALQPLANLKNLSLSFGVVYSDNVGARSRTPWQDVVPKSVTELLICQNGFDESRDLPESPSQDWLLDDLNRFLQDDYFERLRLVRFDTGNPGIEISIDEETASRHGWVVIEDNKRCLELENKGRPGSFSK